jgi:hypothetical protein
MKAIITYYSHYSRKNETVEKSLPIKFIKGRTFITLDELHNGIETVLPIDCIRSIDVKPELFKEQYKQHLKEAIGELDKILKDLK